MWRRGLDHEAVTLWRANCAHNGNLSTTEDEDKETLLPLRLVLRGLIAARTGKCTLFWLRTGKRFRRKFRGEHS